MRLCGSSSTASKLRFSQMASLQHPLLDVVRAVRMWKSCVVVWLWTSQARWLAPIGRGRRRGSIPQPKNRQFHAEVADMSLYQQQPGSVRPDALLPPPESIRERCHLIGGVTSTRSTSSIISCILFTAIFNGTRHCLHSRTISVIEGSCADPGLHPALSRDAKIFTGQSCRGQTAQMPLGYEGRVDQAIAARGPEHVWAAGSERSTRDEQRLAGRISTLASPEILACLAI